MNKSDLQEDFQDSLEIKEQKQEQQAKGEKMSTWKPGKGLVKEKDASSHVRDHVQQKG